MENKERGNFATTINFSRITKKYKKIISNAPYFNERKKKDNRRQFVKVKSRKIKRGNKTRHTAKLGQFGGLE